MVRVALLFHSLITTTFFRQLGLVVRAKVWDSHILGPLLALRLLTQPPPLQRSPGCSSTAQGHGLDCSPYTAQSSASWDPPVIPLMEGLLSGSVGFPLFSGKNILFKSLRRESLPPALISARQPGCQIKNLPHLLPS